MTITRRLLLAGALLGTPVPALARRRPPAAGSSRHGTGAAPPPPLVLLDPGHGGKDPGAIGVSGTYEKHVAFAVAEELCRQLLATRRYRVRLTRAQDVFVPLADRVGLAERQGAALFVSMHADALADHGVRGASVYTLGAAASDAQSAALARRENSADRFADPRFADQPESVARILASLVRQETTVASLRLQQGAVAALGAGLPMLANPARRAAFAVLKSTEIPSVLVEMGFMSNPQDEAALRRPDHRARVAGAMRRAVDGYFAGAVAGLASAPA